MSEITKLYENAEIEKEVIKGCYDYYSKLGIDIWKENDCSGKNCNTCKKDKSIKRYPPFTAEKQIELIKLLAKRLDFGLEYYQDKTWSVQTQLGWDGFEEMYEHKNFAEALSGLINILWQDLTPEEKQQVKGILE